MTPNAASKTYGDVDPALSGALVGFLDADAVTPTYSRTAGETVGAYVISATLAPVGVLGNYAITSNTAVFTINKATLTVTADNKTTGSRAASLAKSRDCGRAARPAGELLTRLVRRSASRRKLTSSDPSFVST